MTPIATARWHLAERTADATALTNSCRAGVLSAKTQKSGSYSRDDEVVTIAVSASTGMLPFTRLVDDLDFQRPSS